MTLASGAEVGQPPRGADASSSGGGVAAGDSQLTDTHVNNPLCSEGDGGGAAATTATAALSGIGSAAWEQRLEQCMELLKGPSDERRCVRVLK